MARPVDYVDMMQRGPELDQAAAKAPVVSFERVKSKRLTKKQKSAQLMKRKTERPKMAKKRRTAKQKAATKKMIAANRRRARGGSKTVRVRGKTARAAAVVIANEVDTQHPRYKKKPKKKAAKKKSAAKKSGSPRRSSKRSRKGVRRVRRARAVITVSAAEKRRPRRRHGESRSTRREAARASSRRRRRSRRSGALENPLTGIELFVGTITGLIGFGTADVVDRMIATHALTASGTGTTGVATYTDTPPTASPAQGTEATYGSLFNATAVCAPMNLERWAVGLLIAGAPIGIGHFISAPVGRSALQFFGFGALMRVAGKGLIDLVATLTLSNQTGQQLYSGEQRAAAIMKNDGSVSSLPTQASTGLGRPQMSGRPPVRQLAGHRTGCGCQSCSQHHPGAGYPSMPTPVAPTVTQAPTPQPITSPTPPATDQTATTSPTVSGLPHLHGVGFTPRRGVYGWGEKTKAA